MMKSKRMIFTFLYLGTILLFVVYLIFLSDNNVRKHQKLNEQKEYIESSITKTKNQINNRYTSEELAKDSFLLEQYIREQLNMQKKNEDVFLFVYE